MKLFLKSVIPNVIFVILMANTVTYAQNFDGQLDFNRLQELSKSAATEPQYQAAMQVLREQMRKSLLPNIWQKTQENPELQIGAIRTSDLFQKLSRFNLFQNNTSLVLQADSERKSDFYALNQSWGVVNTEQMQVLFKTNAGLLLPLHIFLGASGYQDENYQLSLALVLLDRSMERRSDLKNIDIQSLLPHSKENLFKVEPTLLKNGANTAKKNLKNSNGGFTGVGGGGDGRSLLVKIELISKYLFVFSNSSPNGEMCFKKWADPLLLLKDILAVEIESSDQMDEVKLDYSNNYGRILIPSYNPLDQKKLQSVVQSSLAILCLIQGLKK